MPAMLPTTVATHSATRAPLVLAPFRGVRFDAARVGNLAAVTAPPYDVVDEDGVSRLETSDPHNVVRLILPRDVPADAQGRYQVAAGRLAAWQRDGTLRRDPERALYVCEQAGPGGVQRGLLGALALRQPEEGVVLPHEDVMPGPVADRFALLRATMANLEPILLLHTGGHGARQLIDAVTRRQPPSIDTVDVAGWRQRVWPVTDESLLASVAMDLAPQTALIADGHHRYATYLRLQQERRAAGSGAGPWDFGLALLVDADAYPPDIRAIHRTVSGQDLQTCLASSAGGFESHRLAGSAASAAAALDVLRDYEPDAPAYVLTDGTRWALLRSRQGAGRPTPPAAGALGGRDAAVLHSELLGRDWAVPESDVDYHHDADEAVLAVRRHGGVAVLMRPVSLAEVHAVAAAGRRMPRKSTSFGPKPRSGLVMRLLDETDAAVDVPP
jgi:uncharacterized protein (DUF1015 family)